MEPFNQYFSTVGMASFSKKFELLKREMDDYFHTEFESAEAETRENVRIKSEILDLISKAKESGDAATAVEVTKSVIDYLCEICGHSEDLEILRNHTPSALSPEELEYIIHNSALSRWF